MQKINEVTTNLEETNVKYSNTYLDDDGEDLDLVDEVGGDQEDDDLDFIDLSQFTSVQSTSKSKASSEAGIMTIVNSKKHGKRITFPKQLIQKLKASGAINIVLADHALMITSADAAAGNEFPYKVAGKKVIIYATDLIHEITTHYGLDFSNCVSKTFHKVKYSKTHTHIVAVITIK